MGNSPLAVCIHQAWEKQTVEVVLPDGQVLYMPHPLTVAMLLESHPAHFVCQGSPSILEQRLSADTRLESGEIYYLLPIPRPAVYPAASFHRNPMQPQCRKLVEKVTYRPSLGLEKSPPRSGPEYGHLNLKPQGCLINFFVFRQSVASVMPEESFKIQAEHFTAPRPPVRKHPRFESRQRGVRGRRRQVITWKPHLKSISETKPVQDFTVTLQDLNGLSDSLFTAIDKTLSSPPRDIARTLSSPPRDVVRTLSSPPRDVAARQLGGDRSHAHQQQAERENQKHKLMYCA